MENATLTLATVTRIEGSHVHEVHNRLGQFKGLVREMPDGQWRTVRNGKGKDWPTVRFAAMSLLIED
jgi:hypothetical protein